MANTKTKFLALLALITLTLVLSACNANANNSGSARTQWEYLIVNAGTASFEYAISASDPDPKFIESAGDRRPLIGTAPRTAERLDMFGSNGWELVGIVGQINTVQHFVFKRPL